MNTYYITGIVMLIGGIYIRYQIGKRRFNRRNPSGLQQFKSYRSGIFTTFTENFLCFSPLSLLLGVYVYLLGVIV